MQFSLIALLALPILTVADCSLTDEYCHLTSLGWKPAAASYINTALSDVAAAAGTVIGYWGTSITSTLPSPTRTSSMRSNARNSTSAITSGAHNATTTSEAPSVTIFFTTTSKSTWYAPASATWASVIHNFETTRLVGPEQYSRANELLSQLATTDLLRQPAQSIVAQALSLQNGAGPEAKPTDAAFMAMMGAAAAAGVGLVL